MDIVCSATACALRGLQWACRFLWVNPYSAADLPGKSGTVCDSQFKNITGPVPVSRGKHARQERSGVLHRQLLKTEREIQWLKSQLTNERLSWEQRFLELQRKQQELREQMFRR